MSARRARESCARRWPVVRGYITRSAWDQRELYRWIGRAWRNDRRHVAALSSAIDWDDD